MLSGPPVASALIEKLGANRVSVQGVDYPADAAGNANLGGSGGPAMAELAQQALSACPDTKLVLSGYSQGAMVVHNAISSIGGTSVSAVVNFGDPLNGQGFDGLDDSKVLQTCGSSDFLCSSGGTNVQGGHISYSDDGAAAATFAIEVCFHHVSDNNVASNSQIGMRFVTCLIWHQNSSIRACYLRTSREPLLCCNLLTILT